MSFSHLHHNTEELLKQLQHALEQGDRVLAQRLIGDIQQRLAHYHYDYRSAEERLQQLIQSFDQQSSEELEKREQQEQPPKRPRGKLDPSGKLDLAAGARAVRAYPQDLDSAWLDHEPELGGALVKFDTVQRGGITVSTDSDRIYPVWYGTNRQPLATPGYSGERHSQVSYGRVEVHVPQSYRFGEAPRPFWKRLLSLDWRDHRLRVQRIEALDAERFFAQLQQVAAEASADYGEAQALVFIHGYNVSFEAAAIRAAQLGLDLKIPGATAFFSWPSRATPSAYWADEASIGASEAALTQFLLDFTHRCGAQRVHLIAHSMGNRGLLRSLQRIASTVAQHRSLRFGQIFLAAPDVDRDLFIDLAQLLPQYAQRATLYASRSDKALFLSSALHAAPRAGYFEPYTIAAGVDTIAVPSFNIDLLGHSFYAQAEALLHDIHSLTRHDTVPAQRQRIQALQVAGTRLWQIQA